MNIASRITTLAVLSTLACNPAQADDPTLPPAAGEDSPERKPLPKIDDLADASSTTKEKRTYIGSLFVKERVEIATDSTGRLASVKFEEGETVKKGDMLFRLEGKPAKLNLSRSRKGLAAAEHQVATAKRELARIQELYDAGAATPASLDQAQAAYDGAQIQLEDAGLAVSMGRTNVSDLVTRAPIDGVVVERFKDPGETVTSMPPTVVLAIEDHGTLELRFRVPERALKDFQPGTEVEAIVPALGTSRTVTVTRTGPSVDPRTRTIEILCDVNNEDHQLKPGMSIEVTPTA